MLEMLGIFLVGFFLCMLIYKENFYYKCNEFIYDGVFELFNGMLFRYVI